MRRGRQRAQNTDVFTRKFSVQGNTVRATPRCCHGSIYNQSHTTDWCLPLAYIYWKPCERKQLGGGMKKHRITESQPINVSVSVHKMKQMRQMYCM